MRNQFFSTTVFPVRWTEAPTSCSVPLLPLLLVPPPFDRRVHPVGGRFPSRRPPPIGTHPDRGITRHLVGGGGLVFRRAKGRAEA